MKSNTKIKITILLIIGIIFPFPILFNKNINDKDKINFNEPKLKKSENSERIHIKGNAGWIAFKNAGNCSGEGTQSDPYIIEDLEIDGGGTGSCIIIKNSDIYFKVENCNLFNSGYNPSIDLVNVDNSRIINNDCSSTISLSDCHYNMLVANTVSGPFGIVCKEDGHSCRKAVYYLAPGGLRTSAIKLVSSNYNDILGNIVHSGVSGLFLSQSKNNTVLGNTISENYMGIYCEGCDNTIITNNIIDNSSYGIYLDGYCNYNTISENNIKKYITGINLHDSNNNKILGNYIKDKNGM